MGHGARRGAALQSEAHANETQTSDATPGTGAGQKTLGSHGSQAQTQSGQMRAERPAVPRAGGHRASPGSRQGRCLRRAHTWRSAQQQPACDEKHQDRPRALGAAYGESLCRAVGVSRAHHGAAPQNRKRPAPPAPSGRVAASGTGAATTTTTTLPLTGVSWCLDQGLQIWAQALPQTTGWQSAEGEVKGWGLGSNTVVGSPQGRRCPRS